MDAKRGDATAARTVGDPGLYRIALWIVVTALLSGPVGAAIGAIGAEPWTDAATFAASAKPWHQLPYWLGFLFVGAWIAFLARLVATAPQDGRARAVTALAAGVIYGAMITLNYTIQVSYVPVLARTADPAIGYLTMANPRAFAWSLEMFGYGALGVAVWLVAPLFAGTTRRRRLIVLLLYANGAVSVGSAAAMAIDAAWTLTPIGLAGYLLWNALVVGGMTAIAVECRRGQGMSASTQPPGTFAAYGAVAWLRLKGHPPG